MYVDDSTGLLPYSWNQLKDNLLIGLPGVQTASFLVTAAGLPAYGSNGFAFWYYPYIRNGGVFNCPALRRSGAPAAFYVDTPAPMFIQSHYRQNPYFGHNGYGGGNLAEFTGPGILAHSSDYRITGRIGHIGKAADTVLNFDVSQHRFAFPYTGSPATANTRYLGGGADRTLPASYSAASYMPNMGFFHAGKGSLLRGNFSFVDGHVESLGTALLEDLTDYRFKLLK
jgi:prepilin-type processing-associated H-X9-DG protein